MKVDAIFVRQLVADTESEYYYVDKSAGEASAHTIDIDGPLVTVTDHDGATKIFYGLPYEATKEGKK